jgi:hypothetical protein
MNDILEYDKMTQNEPGKGKEVVHLSMRSDIYFQTMGVAGSPRQGGRKSYDIEISKAGGA